MPMPTFTGPARGERLAKGIREPDGSQLDGIERYSFAVRTVMDLGSRETGEN